MDTIKRVLDTSLRSVGVRYVLDMDTPRHLLLSVCASSVVREVESFSWYT